MTLIEQLKNAKYAPSDSKWVQFIIDHKNYIIENSTVVTLDKNTMNTYKFKPLIFLSSKNVSYDVMWIVCFINGFLDPINFHNLYSIYIPNESVIYNLKIKYNTFVKSLNS